MPISIDTVAGGTSYANPFVGPVDHPAAVRVDVSGLTSDEIDQNGYLKPGVPLDRDGVLVGTGVAVYGVSLEPIKVAASNAAADIAAATDVDVALGLVGAVNRAVIEDILGRALTADEIAGFAAGGSKIQLIY